MPTFTVAVFLLNFLLGNVRMQSYNASPEYHFQMKK